MICDIAALEPRKTNLTLVVPIFTQPKRPRRPIPHPLRLQTVNVLRGHRAHCAAPLATVHRVGGIQNLKIPPVSSRKVRSKFSEKSHHFSQSFTSVRIRSRPRRSNQSSNLNIVNITRL
jgi:hypothetical protein